MVGCSELVQSRRRFPLLVIDETHLLPAGAFEQFRLLLSDQMDSHSLASLLLVGQPPLRDTLRLAGNQAFYQRLTVRCHLQPLDLQHSIANIKHHIHIAGFQGGQLFSDNALGRIFDDTKGVPRQINLLTKNGLRLEPVFWGLHGTIYLGRSSLLSLAGYRVNTKIKGDLNYDTRLY